MDELEVRTRMGGEEAILDFLDKNLKDNLKKIDLRSNVSQPQEVSTTALVDWMVRTTFPVTSARA